MRSTDNVGRSPHRIILVGCNPLANRYLRALLERHGGFEVMDRDQLRGGPFSCQKSPGIFLIDSESLRVPLFQCLRSLQSDFPGSKFFVIGHGRLGEELPGLLSIGIRGFVEYKVVEKELPDAIRAVAAGHLWIPEELLERYVSKCHNHFGDHRHSHDFTQREESITGLLKQNLSNKEIARALGITERTVKFHLGNIYTKLGVHDRHRVGEFAGGGRENARPGDPRAVESLPAQTAARKEGADQSTRRVGTNAAVSNA